MNRIAVSCALLLAVATFGRLASAQCQSDADCKGERVCVNGQCVVPGSASATPEPAPAPAPAPAAAPAPAPAPAPVQPAAAPPPAPRPRPTALDIQPFGKVYGEFAAMVGIGSWGQKRMKASDNDDDDAINDMGIEKRKAGTGPFGGIYAAGRFAVSKGFHIGMYFRVGKGENVGVRIEDGDDDFGPNYSASDLDNIAHIHLGVGGSLKFGGMVGRRVWMGAAADFGLHVTKIDEGEFVVTGDDDDPETYVGFEVYPKMCIDIYLFRFERINMSIPITVGAAVIPYMKVKKDDMGDDPPVDWDSDTKVWSWQIEPIITLGLAVGI